MSKSLQEQLVRAGLIDKKKAKQIKAEQRKISRKQPRRAASENIRQENGGLSRERDRELNRQQQARNQQKAVAAQVRQIVEAGRLPPEQDGDIAFHFVDGGKVKKIRVTQELRDRISAGKLAIVKMDGRYDLVPSSLVGKLRNRSETCVIFHNDERAGEAEAEADYPGHEVPDDLIW